MGIDIVDATTGFCPGQAHSPRRTIRRWRNHIEAIATRAVSSHLGVNTRTSTSRMLKLLKHQDACTTRNHKAIARCIVGP